MDLTDRQMNILKAIVKDYVETAEAVGSTYGFNKAWNNAWFTYYIKKI